MLNHARTLLLNENSGYGAPWHVDPSFVPVPVPGALAPFNALLFADAPDRADAPARAASVSAMMPFVLDPEFRVWLRAIDSRTTVPEDAAPWPTSRTASSFLARMAPGAPAMVSRCVSSTAASRLFSVPAGEASPFDAAVSELSAAYMAASESAKKFSACLVAYILGMERERLRRIPKGGPA